ncbi:SOH1-domain-containing protein [Venturia nashicola]|uniref:Mediator of RNA polymerase II transcription subunit 31 n=1 Tax=Venturia nashicola TaxID=86259 RepID=A0A4Z1P7Y6_9PEZI|nr:SOH1-domain-containing protein [Venturia nashicola]TLD36553.1 SOH1-domain-containing protein [Venturia nashicola]
MTEEAPPSLELPKQVPDEPRYGGFSRFELELEFVQCLSNPWYIHELWRRKLFDEKEFVAYLDYLQYFKTPKYARFLSYPGTTLQNLELLQQDLFRKECGNIGLIHKLCEEGIRSAEDRPTS